MTERSWDQTPHYGNHFSGTIHLDQSLEEKLWKTLTWHCCMCCNPANGRVDFEEWSAYKIQLRGTEWIVSLSADWDQRKKQKILSTAVKYWSLRSPSVISVPSSYHWLPSAAIFLHGLCILTWVNERDKHFPGTLLSVDICLAKIGNLT